MAKAKVLLDDDPVGRWKKGEVGELLDNDYDEKYDYRVDFGIVKDVELFGKKIDWRRIVYFYKGDLELIV